MVLYEPFYDLTLIGVFFKHHNAIATYHFIYIFGFNIDFVCGSHFKPFVFNINMTDVNCLVTEETKIVSEYRGSRTQGNQDELFFVQFCYLFKNRIVLTKSVGRSTQNTLNTPDIVKQIVADP